MLSLVFKSFFNIVDRPPQETAENDNNADRIIDADQEPQPGTSSSSLTVNKTNISNKETNKPNEDNIDLLFN